MSFLFFAYFSPIFPLFFLFWAYLSSYLLGLGVFLFCSWPTRVATQVGNKSPEIRPPWLQPGGLAESHVWAKRKNRKGKIIYSPSPPPPRFWSESILKGGGGWRGGVYFDPPPRQEFYTPPLFCTPPFLEGYFQGWGGGGCINFGLVK